MMYMMQMKASNNMKRKFSEKEDQIILQMVEHFGIHSWNKISEALGTRTPRQCRERWRHYLKPVIKPTSWTQEEDQLLEMKFNELGPKWSIIAPFLPGRTEVNVKNRWTRICRIRKKQNKTSSKAKTTKKVSHQKQSEISSTKELEKHIILPQQSCSITKKADFIPIYHSFSSFSSLSPNYSNRNDGSDSNFGFPLNQKTDLQSVPCGSKPSREEKLENGKKSEKLFPSIFDLMSAENIVPITPLLVDLMKTPNNDKLV
ncbi:Myb-like DNA-binding domain containing protein [Tritrichomonas foetus]|uniref:Myb-like DNA-binding domain containing protein n=1 Tax=Tritrichomonas foetus TaxID=1144522 RepID=A0A1J4K8I5_9EUKA|nr:Myb-like DNA-binding domain containing protein [Tritrichomonas foetus]|eukprot:OHT05741.1 Myb-like DNA-binding domain containing protein [Tritrichomonas foetus]